ncbi:MAG TPA: aminomethyl-transferring glycine dehydrogenase subunit GcvPA [Anaerolineae bacterium]|nr:aminomethyl-transferring glycine dehydrogenase subunit GcvPA [Anaerolineae bacterium]
MTYIPHTDADRRAMLAAIGVEKIEDLFNDVPARVRFPKLNLPPAATEMEVWWEMNGLSEANADVNHYACFLGAGAYNHYTPHTVDYVLRRGEFYTAYTPYQPEISQGTLQAMFEYQSMICQLTGMDVSNASHYDGATSLAEGALLALNSTRGNRKKIILSPAVHPQYRQVVRTYLQGAGVSIIGDNTLKNEISDLKSLLDDQTAALIIQNPNFFGYFEEVQGLAEAVHAVGALLIVVPDLISLGLFQPPGEYGADVVCAEGQALGIPLSFGGPYLGVFATKNAFVRKMAGRLVGETTDADGKRGYVLTLSTREQHIRREKATSNICTNVGLVALGAAVYMATVGKCGLEQVAKLCYHKSHYAAEQIGKLKGYAVHPNTLNKTPKRFFKEFVVKCPRPVAEINALLMEEFEIIGGYDLGQDYSALKNHLLVAVTETNTKQEIDDLVEGLKQAAG